MLIKPYPFLNVFMVQFGGIFPQTALWCFCHPIKCIEIPNAGFHGRKILFLKRTFLPTDV